MKESVTIDDVSLKTNLKIIQTLFFIKKSFFFTNLGFTRSLFCPLVDIDGFYQLIGGSYKNDKPFNVTGNDKVHLNCDCVDSSIVNRVREPILYNFALYSPPGHKKKQKT